MLRECPNHGYYRGESCADCGEEGRFLMNSHELDRVGRILAGALRHFPEKFGVTMDAEGWVRIEEFCNELRDQKDELHWVKPYHIVALGVTDPKGRYQIEGEQIRATYAHSIDVDLSSLPEDDVPRALYYPVSEEELDVVLDRGLTPADRKMVHLSGTYESAVTAGEHRVDEPIILEIDAAKAQETGITIRKAGTTVYVTDEVPPRFVDRAE